MPESLAYFATIVSAVAALYSLFYANKKHKELHLAYDKLVGSYTTAGDNSVSRKVGKNTLLDIRDDLKEILSATSDSMTHLSGKKIVGSLKLIENDDGIKYAVTFLRDENSSHYREVMKYKYPLSINSIYSSIFDKNEVDEYVNNDVDNITSIGYLNADWGKSWGENNFKNLYKSVLVVPVKDDKSDNVLGFLTFDSKDSNAFSDVSVELAEQSGAVTATLLKNALSKSGLMISSS